MAALGAPLKRCEAACFMLASGAFLFQSLDGFFGGQRLDL
jgi:hypothetical protein